MLKLACIFLLFLACVIAGPTWPCEEKKTVIQWIGVSTDYNTSELDATVRKAWDGDINTWVASTYESQPFLSVTFRDQAYVTYVDIVNRQDCCQDRINPFTVFLGRTESGQRKTVDQWKAESLLPNPVYTAWRDGTGTNSTYRIFFPRVDSVYARFQIHKTDYLNIAEISFVQLPRVRYLSATASSIYQNTPLNNAIDGNANTWFATDNEVDGTPWFEVRFEPQYICTVHVWNRYEPCCSARINPFVISLKMGNYTARSPGPNQANNYCNLELDHVCSAEQTGVKDYYVIDFPGAPYVDRARIFQKTPGYLNIADIQIYACRFPYVPPTPVFTRTEEQEAH